jgi:Ulp1 family protease
MKMLQERDNHLCLTDIDRLPSHFFNSFFLAKIMQKDLGVYDYAQVMRWCNKFDVFAMDKLFFPINLSNTHWTMAVVSMQLKEIYYYDSMSGRSNRGKYVDILLHWLDDEAKHRCKTDKFIRADWNLFHEETHVPLQTNGYDCAVFAILCADFLSDNLPLHYDQSSMPLYRRKIVAAIIRGSLNYPMP